MGLEFVYPNGSKKALSFTIDDGNIEWDTRLLNILKPHGIKGTFNLCGRSKKMTDAALAEFYRGYGIANHCLLHPHAMTPERDRPRKTEPFNRETADEGFLYPHAEADGLYYMHLPHGWRTVATDECYLALAAECTAELEDVFGKGSIRDFVWPFGEQKNERVLEGLKALGFRSVRKTGDLGASTDFNLPADRFAWSYNASDRNLLEFMEQYEKAEDNGRLRFFSFGVHSIDFERSGKWDMLAEFAEKYGDRPNDYYYASINDIFDYEDATKCVEFGSESVINRSDKTVYIINKGSVVALQPGAEIFL